MHKETNLSAVHADGNLTVAPDKRVGVVWSEWNPEITEALRDGCLETLRSHGVRFLHCISVPGSFELPYAAQ